MWRYAGSRHQIHRSCPNSELLWKPPWYDCVGQGVAVGWLEPAVFSLVHRAAGGMATVTSSSGNTEVVTVRRTEARDVPAISSLFSPFTEDVFGRIDVTYLLWVMVFCVVTFWEITLKIAENVLSLDMVWHNDFLCCFSKWKENLLSCLSHAWQCKPASLPGWTRCNSILASFCKSSEEMLLTKNKQQTGCVTDRYWWVTYVFPP